MRKVALVGKASTGNEAPWHSPDWEIWGMPWITAPRYTRLFDLHEQAMYDEADVPPSDVVWNEKWLDHTKEYPIYTFKSRMHIPNAVEYPLEEVLNDLPIPYLENSVAYMMALAIYEEVDEIGLWGVHMRGAPTYEIERPSITYLAGLANGRGIKVHIPPGNPLMMSAWEQGRYGIDFKRRPDNPMF